MGSMILSSDWSPRGFKIASHLGPLHEAGQVVGLCECWACLVGLKTMLLTVEKNYLCGCAMSLNLE